MFGRSKLSYSLSKFLAGAGLGYTGGSSVMLIIKEVVNCAPYITYPICILCALIAGGVATRIEWTRLGGVERENIEKSAEEEEKETAERTQKAKLDFAVTELSTNKCLDYLRAHPLALEAAINDDTVREALHHKGYMRPRTPSSYVPLTPSSLGEHRKSLRERKSSLPDNIHIQINSRISRDAGYSPSQSPSPVTSASPVRTPHFHREESASPNHLEYTATHQEQKEFPAMSAANSAAVEFYELSPDGVPQLTAAPLLGPTHRSTTMPLPLGHSLHRTAQPYYFVPTLPTPAEGVEYSTSQQVSVRMEPIVPGLDCSPQVSQRGLSSHSRGAWVSGSPATSNRGLDYSPFVSSRRITDHSDPTQSPQLGSRHRVSGAGSELSGDSPFTVGRKLPGISPSVPSERHLQPHRLPMQSSPLVPSSRSLVASAEQPSVEQQMQEKINRRYDTLRSFWSSDSIPPPDEPDTQRIGGGASPARSSSRSKII